MSASPSGILELPVPRLAPGLSLEQAPGLRRSQRIALAQSIGYPRVPD